MNVTPSIRQCGLSAALLPTPRTRPGNTWRTSKPYLRARVVERDGRACFYCATELGGDRPATLDHLWPRAIRPTDSPNALVLACLPCNRAKGRRVPSKLVRALGHSCPPPVRTWLFQAPAVEVLAYLRPLLQGRFRPGLEPGSVTPFVTSEPVPARREVPCGPGRLTARVHPASGRGGLFLSDATPVHTDIREESA
ncbi:HNH endonuclease [Embleya sp. NPDC059259]|uniref:HNH endonuclease n=1 Tax=unclassified Embleya TaxID=2699296 RepID=UPI003679A023